jgi:hypothetical protein
VRTLAFSGLPSRTPTVFFFPKIRAPLIRTSTGHPSSVLYKNLVDSLLSFAVKRETVQKIFSITYEQLNSFLAKQLAV